MKRVFYIIEFLTYYLFQLVWSNIYLAILILSPRLKIKTGFIDVAVDLKSDIGILLFSNLVSMTPGSLVTNIAHDKKTATVHVLYTSDENKIRSDVQRMQDKIKRITN